MRQPTTCRAVADPLTLVLVGLIALAAGVFGTSWKPFEFLKPKPPTEQLTKLQDDLAKANAAAEQARKDREAAVAAERAKLEQQVRAAQEDNAGTQAALAVAPSGPEVKLAKEMAVRVDMKLAAAIGDLPKANREAMLKLIADALAGKDAEFAAAMAKRDVEFATLRAERDQVAAQIPILSQKATKAEEQAKVIATEKTKVENKVAEFAAKADAKEREAGGFKASAERAINVIIGLVAVWAFLAYVLPGLIKHMDAANPMKAILRNVSGYTCAPLLFADAKKKLAQLTKETP
jgi:hypothetical protein